MAYLTTSAYIELVQAATELLRRLDPLGFGVAGPFPADEYESEAREIVRRLVRAEGIDRDPASVVKAVFVEYFQVVPSAGHAPGGGEGDRRDGSRRPQPIGIAIARKGVITLPTCALHQLMTRLTEMLLSRRARRREARAILRSKLLELEVRGGRALTTLVDQPEHERVLQPSGGEFTIDVSAFWDIAPRDSDLYVEVAVSPVRPAWVRPRKAGLVVHPYNYEIVRYSNFPDVRLPLVLARALDYSVTKREADRILAEALLELEVRGAERLVELVDAPEKVTVTAWPGRRYEVASSAFWDIEAWVSPLYVEVKVSPLRSGVLPRPRRAGLTADPVRGRIWSDRGATVVTAHPSYGAREKVTGRALLSEDARAALAARWATLDEDGQRGLAHDLASAVLLWLMGGRDAWFEVDILDHDERAAFLASAEEAGARLKRRRGAIGGELLPTMVGELLTGTQLILIVVIGGGRSFEVHEYLDTIEVLLDERDVDGLLRELSKPGGVGSA